MTYQIIPKYGHFEVHINGQFYSSADTWTEAARDAERALYKVNA